MPAAARVGDVCTGHGPCSPRPAVSGSPDVFVNGIPAHRVGDAWAVHCTHDSVLAAGSRSVFVNGRAKGRVSDPVACGSLVAAGSPNVFVGG
ncbi:MAG: PAAR domain-containing protein [Pseudomonadota bacterium]